MIGSPLTSENPEEMALPTSSQERGFGEEWPAQACGGPPPPISSEPGPIFEVDFTEAANAGVTEIDDIAPVLIQRHRKSLSELAEQ